MKLTHAFCAIAITLALVSLSHGQNITLLLNSQTISGTSDGSPLSIWNGDVGSATSSGANAMHAPTYISTSNVNGLPGVRFNGVPDNPGQGMVTTLTQTSGEYTVMTIYSHNDTSDADSNFRRVLNGGANAGTENWLIGPYGEQHRHYAGNNWVTNPGPAAGSAPTLATAVNNGTTSTFFVDGVDETDNPAPSGFFGELALGTAGQFAEAADSDVALVLAFDEALTSDELVGVEYILAENFGLTGFTANEQQIALGNQLLAGTSLAAVPEPASVAIWSLLGCLMAAYVWRRRLGRGRHDL